MKDFQGKVAVITGAASGIGRALAFRFAKEGMKVVVADIEEISLGATTRELQATGADVLSVTVNVGKRADVETLATRALNRFGAVDVLCNNAGVGAKPRATWEYTQSDWEWVFNANLWSVVNGLHTFVPTMIRQGTEGHIVNTAAMSGLVGLPNFAPYVASKHAVVAITESLHYELGFRKTKLKASVLCPGYVNTKITDGARPRPGSEELRDATLEVQLMEEAKSRAQTALPPEAVADLVLEGIREEKFYILTHPERKADFAWRSANIMEERNPDPQALLNGWLGN
ncbi:short-chain dehydrogenase [Bryobacterales bacterium F-183]|nr:short-chain dehydrogenase [Bryobacterales bacterium F-183]